MSLTTYKEKRSPKTTSEPFGTKRKKSKGKKIFVVQKHAASHLHYDFRLEAEGVLKSWAIPKGPTLNPAEKHLAVMVEDHPYDYRDFEGTIPKGSYGGGTVMVWDYGFYEPLDEKGKEATEKTFLEGIKKGKISFRLQGEKLKGRFSLVRMHGESGEKENWLIFKANDEFATTEEIKEQDYSVLTHRTMDEIANDDPPQKERSQPKKKSLNQSLKK